MNITLTPDAGSQALTFCRSVAGSAILAPSISARSATHGIYQ
ncbi:MAG: hypothetical protein ACJAS0_002585 [Alcanivorax borkumensis]|jgi:hypothetical protein